MAGFSVTPENYVETRRWEEAMGPVIDEPTQQLPILRQMLVEYSSRQPPGVYLLLLMLDIVLTLTVLGLILIGG